MRPVDDLAIRARNWFWYWRVRDISGLGNDALDRKCFGIDSGRKRHFERLQQTAASPDGVALLDGDTLLEIVDAWDSPDGQNGPYAPATQDFQSKLWFFLSSRDIEPSVYSDYIQQHVQQRGWMRICVSDFSLYRTFLGESEPAIEHGVSTAYSAMLHKIANEGTPDMLALLIALFREAMFGVYLEQAIAIKSALKGCLAWMCKLNEMPDAFVRLLWQLVNDRVLSNIWLTEVDWRQYTSTVRKRSMSSHDRTKEFQAWVDWYIGDARASRRTGYGLYPIVPRSPRIDWIEVNREELLTVREYIEQLRGKHRGFRDSYVPNARAYADAAQEEINRLLRLFVAPEANPARFYEERPALEIGNLPQAY